MATTAGCGALEDAPISNATANANPAVKQRKAQAPPKKTEKTGKSAKADPVGTRNDMEPMASSSDVPAWVIAINWAQGKLGHKYVWGGESDQEGGFDCSGLMQAAYAQAGIRLPRVANDQYAATDVHPKRSDLRPGDLVFYGATERGIHHVGLYVGSGMMLHAPNSRSVIRFDKVSYMADYYGATRVG